MARYLTIDSEFNPITFQERMAPLEMYKKEYESQQDALEKISAESQSLADLANSSLDADIYNQYKSYQNELETSIDNLINNGKLDINAISRLRHKYNMELYPYEAKLKKRNALIAQQAKDYKDGIMYDIDYSNAALNDITDGSTYRTYNLNDIAKTTGEKLLSQYVANGRIGNEQEEIESIFKDIDTNGLSEEQKNTIKSYIQTGRNTAAEGFAKNILEKQYKQEQINALRTANNAPTTTETTDSKGKKVAVKLKSGLELVFTVKNGKWFDSKGVDRTSELKFDESGNVIPESASKFNPKASDPKYMKEDNSSYTVDGGIVNKIDYDKIRESGYNVKPFDLTDYNNLPLERKMKVTSADDVRKMAEKFGQDMLAAFIKATGGENEEADFNWFDAGYVFYVAVTHTEGEDHYHILRVKSAKQTENTNKKTDEVEAPPATN